MTAIVQRVTDLERGATMAMKWAGLASLSGTNIEAMLNWGLQPDVILSDRPGTRAVDVVAAGAGVPAIVVNRRHFGYSGPNAEWRRDDFTTAVIDRLQLLKIELVVMAGFMTILAPHMFESFIVINTHPALLRDFKGATAVADTLASGATETGCTIHVATSILDDDRYILAQGKVPVLPGDDVDTLWGRIKQEEYRLYPEVVHGIVTGKRKLQRVA